MFKHSLSSSVKTMVVVLAGIALLAGAAYANHSWGNYHWARSANPFTLELGDNLSGPWTTLLPAVSADWSASSALNTAVVPGSSNRNCKATNGRVEVCNAAYGFNGWLGVAQIWVNGEHIEKAATKLNDTYHDAPPYNTEAWRRFVLCQEIGHTFGLDHQDEVFGNPNLGTCMDYTDDPTRDDGAGDNVQPDAHDFAQLEAIYTHLDPEPTPKPDRGNGNGRGKGRPDLDLSDPGSWGREVRASDGTSLFELGLGNGRKVFTFVIWAR